MTPPPPAIWTCLTGYWQLSEPEAARLWHAVWRSRWTSACTLRQTVLHFTLPPGTPAGVDHVVHFVDTLSPAVMMRVLDELTRERQLSSKMATAITEKVLARVNRHGQWY